MSEIVERRAASGHLLIYEVIGWDSEGYPRLSQWDAVHSPRCHCEDSE